MALVFYAAKTRSGERQAQLPLTIEGELGTTISTFSSATFILDTNSKTCPANYNELLEPHLMSIVAVERDDDNGYSKPIWMGMINDTPSNSDGRLSITCASLEWYLTTRRAKDARFETTNDIMDIPTALIAQVEKDGVGIGLLTDCPASGTKRALVIRESDGQSVVDVLAALDLEWTIALDWADAGQAVVTKTFMCRYPRLGNIVDHPEFMVASPGNVFHWDYTAPMTEGKTATYVVAVGDGTGDLRTTSLPKVDATREAAGYPRVEMYKSFQGVTNVNDADVLADQVSKEVFTRTHAVTTTVRNQGITTFRGITLGSTVRVIIADRGIDEVWRFVGWLMDAQGQFWKPTLGRLAEKVKAFPRAAMPNDTGRALVDMSGRVSLAGYQDPLANGYKFPAGPDGKAFTIDPIAGFGHTDALGAFSAFDNSGGTTGRIWDGSDFVGAQPRTVKVHVRKSGTTEDLYTNSAAVVGALQNDVFEEDTVELKYMYGYTPKVGDLVAIMKICGEEVIMGLLAPDGPVMTGYESRVLTMGSDPMTDPNTFNYSVMWASQDGKYGDNGQTLRLSNKWTGDGGGTPVDNRGAPPSSQATLTPDVGDGFVTFRLPGMYHCEVSVTFDGSTNPGAWSDADPGYYLNAALDVVATVRQDSPDPSIGTKFTDVLQASQPAGNAPTVRAIFTVDATSATHLSPVILAIRASRVRSGGDPKYVNGTEVLGDAWTISHNPNDTWLHVNRVS